MEWSKLLNPNRVRKSTLESDQRINFERDFDRAVFSTPVRRLQDKAQVFPLEPHDAVRTRLTHSLEVASVSKGLAIGAGEWLLKKGEIEADQTRSIEAIAATCGLLHDLGNPPFGHSGEDAIREWFAIKCPKKPLDDWFENPQHVQDFLNFEGNAQTLRLVAKLQILADYFGLNLTFGTLSALCKYTAPSHEADKDGLDHARSKPGFFASETKLVEQIRERTGTGANRNPIAFLVEAADDIVYSVADIEDAIKKGIFSWAQLEEQLKSPECTPPMSDALKIMEKILSTGDDPSSLPDDVKVSAFRTGAISVSVRSVNKAFTDNYEQIMNGEFKSELVKTCDANSLVKTLKRIGREKVYCTPGTLKLELMGRRVIHDLMDVFAEGVMNMPLKGEPKTNAFSGKSGALLSQNYRRVFQHARRTANGIPEQYHRFQLLTDYISGMTDSFAKRLHAEIFNG